MASREPLISSDGPKKSSHCTESSESERASPRPILPGLSTVSSARCQPGRAFPLRKRRPHFPPFACAGTTSLTARVHKGPGRTHTHALKASANAKTKTRRLPRDRSSRASSHAALSSHRKHTSTQQQGAAFLRNAQSAKQKQERSHEQNFGARTPRLEQLCHAQDTRA